MRRRGVLLGVAGAWVGAGCTTDQSLVVIGQGKVPAASVDQAPLALLPEGAISVGRLDAARLFGTGLGQQMGQIVARVLPIGRESGFRPEQDVTAVVGGVYAMQGADFVSVIQGRFDLAGIEAAARAGALTPSRQPLVATEYAGYSMYTVSNVGFVVVTPSTVLSGNETGMRRALDRLRYTKLEPSMPEWIQTFLAENEKAAFAIAGDLKNQGAVQAASGRFPFVVGLELVRILGNFEPPGVNVVGSLTYPDEPQASAGAQGLEQMNQMASAASIFTAMGFGTSLPQLEIKPQGTNVAFATQVDLAVAGTLLGLVAGALGS
ncbi:MAG: hypothetical protein AAGA56_22390 [Myxococcota bacterium]